jgi:hypothetical protein
VANTERAAGDFTTTNTVHGNGQSQWLDNGRTGVSGDQFVLHGNYVVFQSIVADGEGRISVLVDAYDGDGEAGKGSTRLHVCGLQIRPASGMTVDYMQWRKTRQPSVGAPDKDDDGDGFANHDEYLFGLDPTDKASRGAFPLSPDPKTGGFRYTRRAKSLTNHDYKVFYSVDLKSWYEDKAADQVVESLVDDVELVAVTVEPGLLKHPKLHVQVKASPITGIDPEPEWLNLWGSGNRITVLFSEPMNPISSANASNYTLAHDGAGPLAITKTTPSRDGGSVVLTLSTALADNTSYTVSVRRVTSATGQSLGGPISRSFKTWDNNPKGIKVFILAGQSNMVGFGDTEDATTPGSLRYLAVNNASFPDYDYASLMVEPGNPSTSAFARRPDVQVWYRDGGNAQLGGTIRKGSLGPPFMGSNPNRIGPEFAFGQVLGDHYTDHDVLIIKCSWGGRDLAEKFRPPSAVADRGGQVGEFYNAIIDYSRQVLGNLDAEFPAWAGRGYEVVGFGWHQGFNDRINATFSAEYKDNLPDLIEDVRELFNKPELPFVVASTGMAAGAAEPHPYDGYSAVEKAQLWVAGVDRPAKVLSTDTRPFWREGDMAPGKQGHHWNLSAESYFLIGKAMGENMVRLLKP